MVLFLQATIRQTGQHFAKCAQATKEDVDAAVDAAWAAFPAWKALTKEARADILDKIADRIDANTQLLAEVESLDNGKPIRETLAIDVRILHAISVLYASLTAQTKALLRYSTVE